MVRVRQLLLVFISAIGIVSSLFSMHSFSHIRSRAMFFEDQLEKYPNVMQSQISERQTLEDYSTGSIINIGFCRWISSIFLGALVILNLFYVITLCISKQMDVSQDQKGVKKGS